MPSVELRPVVMVAQAVDNSRCDHRTGGEGGENLYAESPFCLRVCLHIHFAENLREEFHSVVIVYCKEFVVILLADFMADDLPVDDGCHLVRPFCLGRMYGDFADFNLSAVGTFPIPAFVLLDVLQVPAVYRGTVLLSDKGCLFVVSLFLSFILQRSKDFLLLLLPLHQLLLHLRMQADSDTLFAVQSLYAYFVGKISFDDFIQDFQPFFNRLVFEGVGSQCRNFRVRQVIDHIGRNLFGLDGQRSRLLIDDKTV